MRRLMMFIVTALTLNAVNAMADSISGRFGVTGRIGAAMPLKDEFFKGTSDTEAGFAFGGGLIYGFCEHVAADIDVFHIPQLDVNANGAKSYEAAITDIALGIQYRFFNSGSVVPYIGIGPDFITGDLKHVNGTGYNLDWTYGGHANIGFDWFITPGIAVTTDFRGVYAADGDVVKKSTIVSEYRPRWFQGMIGLRLMLPEKF